MRSLRSRLLGTALGLVVTVNAAVWLELHATPAGCLLALSLALVVAALVAWRIPSLNRLCLSSEPSCAALVSIPRRTARSGQRPRGARGARAPAGTWGLARG